MVWLPDELGIVVFDEFFVYLIVSLQTVGITYFDFFLDLNIRELSLLSAAYARGCVHRHGWFFEGGARERKTRESTRFLESMKTTRLLKYR